MNPAETESHSTRAAVIPPKAGNNRDQKSIEKMSKFIIHDKFVIDLTRRAATLLSVINYGGTGRGKKELETLFNGTQVSALKRRGAIREADRTEENRAVGGYVITVAGLHLLGIAELIQLVQPKKAGNVTQLRKRA